MNPIYIGYLDYIANMMCLVGILLIPLAGMFAISSGSGSRRIYDYFAYYTFLVACFLLLGGFMVVVISAFFKQ